MYIFTELHSAHLSGPTYLTIGNLDGLHRGHLALIKQMCELAKANSHDTVNIGVITFDPHPRAILRPELSPKLLTSPRQRLLFAAREGATFGVIQPFTKATARMRAVEFMRLLKQCLGLTVLAVGPDFALGKGRSGDINRLREIGDELNYQVVVVPQVEWKGEQVRSSRIRELLSTGDVEAAAGLLSRNYIVDGEVIAGDRRGRTIGIPTANLQVPEDILLPMDGVYATRTWINSHSPEDDCQVDSSESFASVTNLGFRPTINGREHRFETHLLDYSHPDDPDSLYGAKLSVEFVARLRDEKRFEDLNELIAQIKRDIERARATLSTR